MQKIYYCLLNSGEKNIENVALRLLDGYSNNNNNNINKIPELYSKEDNSRRSSLGSYFRTRSKYKQNSFRNNLSSMSLLKNQ